MLETHRVEKHNVDGVGLALRRMGRGVPIVCLTAIGHDAEDFTALANEVGDRFELICIEWPGHGASDRDHQPVSARRYADLVVGLIVKLRIERPVLLGNSIGGAAALLSASRCRARALILCDSGGLVELTPRVRRFCRLFEQFFAAGARGAWWFSAAFALYYRIVLTTSPARAQRRRIVARGRDLAPLLQQAWHSFGQPDADIRDVAAQLAVPVWVAWARHDRVIPLELCRPALERIPDATITEFAAGHTAFLECPEQFAIGLGAFAARL